MILTMDDNKMDYYMLVSYTAAKVGAVLSVGAGGVSKAEWLAANHQWLASLGIIVGMIVGVTGVVANIYFKYKIDKRLDAEAEAAKKAEEKE